MIKDELDLLFRRHAQALYFYLYRLSGSNELAEDLVQDTFVRAAIYLTEDCPDDIKAWLYKVARNAYLDEWRKRQKRKWVPFSEQLFSKKEMLSPYGSPEKELIQGELRKDTEALLQFLQEPYRSIIYLREHNSFTYKELMQALDMTESQVKVNLHRARKKLTQLARERGWVKDDQLE